MKRTLSFILSVVMVATLALTLFVGVGAAKDGDVLWEANFSGTDAKYKPEAFVAENKTAENTPAITNGGKSIYWTFTEEQKGAYMWGDVVEDLKITEDTRYTIEVEYKSHSPKSNGGLTFVAGGTFDKVKANEAGWLTMYGRTFDPSKNAASTFSVYRTRESDYSKTGWNAHNGAIDADGYVTFKIELYGYNVRFYTKQTDGTFAYAFSCAVPEPDRANAVIACGIYAWVNQDSVDEVSIKSFKVLQGCPLTDGILKTKLTEGLANAYKSAKNGDLVYSANFKGDDNFKPVISSTNDKRITGNTMTTSDDGKSLVFRGHTFGTDTKVQAAVWYASPIKGLDVTADTEYTIEFKTLCEGGKYGGAIFLATPDKLPSTYISYYGALNDASTAWTICKGSNTSNYTAYGQMEAKYLNFDERVLVDGYNDVKVEIDGYDVTVYTKTADGYKKVVSYVLDDVNAVLAAGVYNYESQGGVSVKDFNVYKGLTVSNDYSKVEPDPTPTPNPGTGDNTAIAMVLAVISITSLGAVAVAKKAR